MRHHIRALALAGAAAALTAALSTGPAATAAVTTPAAAPTFSITPGGAFSFTGTITLTTSGGVSFTCKVKGTGIFKTGAVQGNHVGTIKTITFTDCTGPAGLSPAAIGNALPWYINFTSYASGAASGNISGIDVGVSGPGCSAVVDGTSGSADNGKTGMKYTNSSAQIGLTKAGGNLHVRDVSGCLGLLDNGEAVTASGTLKVTPAQTVSSP